jgi:Heterokaryon incompatibility protein (HET)
MVNFHGDDEPSVDLRYIRDPARARTLWINAIRISQSDLDEKSSQVAMMEDVYRRAAVCLL